MFIQIICLSNDDLLWTPLLVHTSSKIPMADAPSSSLHMDVVLFYDIVHAVCGELLWDQLMLHSSTTQLRCTTELVSSPHGKPPDPIHNVHVLFEDGNESSPPTPTHKVNDVTCKVSKQATTMALSKDI